jgi:hypothetical protein
LAVEGWRIPGPFTEQRWRIPGPFTEQRWRIPGHFTEQRWRIPGLFTEQRIPGSFTVQAGGFLVISLQRTGRYLVT